MTNDQNRNQGQQTPDKQNIGQQDQPKTGQQSGQQQKQGGQQGSQKGSQDNNQDDQGDQSDKSGQK